MVVHSHVELPAHARGPLRALDRSALNTIKRLMGGTAFNKLDQQLSFEAELRASAEAKERPVLTSSLGLYERIFSDAWFSFRRELRAKAGEVTARLAIKLAVHCGEFMPPTIRGGRGSIDGQLATATATEASNPNPNPIPSPNPRP